LNDPEDIFRYQDDPAVESVGEPPPIEGDPESIIVIGSGFGGAVAACRLKQAGFDVHVLERGRRYGPNDFPPLPVKEDLLPDVQRWTWGDSQGLWDILDLEEIISVQAAGYGGGSLIYANVQLRPPDSVFDHRWPPAYRQGQALAEYFPLGGFMLDAAPITQHAMFPDVVKADQLKKAMDHLGRKGEFFYPPIAVHRGEKKVTIGGRTQKPCIGCGACCSGCPETAKNTLDYNYLAIAEKHGARIRTQCEVTDIRPRATTARPGTDGWEIDYVDHLAGRKRRIRGRHVFLCAGSVHSTRLMARARIKSVQSRVGVGYFPGGDAIGVVYATENVQYPSYGPTITTTTVHWEQQYRAAERGIDEVPALYLLLQDGGYAQQLARLVGILRASAWVGRNKLSEDGKAQVGASPPSRAAEREHPTPNLIAMPSMVDDLASAIAQGNFKGAVPAKFVAAWPRVLTALTKPLLLRPIVTSVIDGAMRTFFETFALTKGFDQAGCFVRTLHKVGRCLIHFFFGTDQQLAERALRSALRGGDLSRKLWAKKVFGYDDSSADHRLMLLAMGRDAARGSLIYYRDTDRLVADLDLAHLAPGYTTEERLMTDVAKAVGGELRTNPAWAFLGKPITVHNQGGCPMSELEEHGVTDPDGKVWGAEGLYVMDGSSLCTSVGVNPSATITAVAERNIKRFIQTQRKNPLWPKGDVSPGAREYEDQWDASRSWGKQWTVSPPDFSKPPDFGSGPLGIEFSETLQGYYTETLTPLKYKDDQYLVLETQGRPSYPIELSLTLAASDLNVFFESTTHTMDVLPKSKLPQEKSKLPIRQVSIRLPGRAAPRAYPVTGGIAQIFASRFKPYGIKQDTPRFRAQERLGGMYRTKVLPASGSVEAALQTRFFNYLVWFTDETGHPWTLFGYKRVRDNPAADAWRDTSTLFVTLFDGKVAPEDVTKQMACAGAGAVHTELSSFLFDQLHGLEATGTTDPLRAAWATTSFATFFFGSLLRIYAPGIGTAASSLFAQRGVAARHAIRPAWRRAR
jgi:choline dehydrogenase-like flavoprotein